MPWHRSCPMPTKPPVSDLAAKIYRRAKGQGLNVHSLIWGALIIRIGSWGILYCNNNHHHKNNNSNNNNNTMEPQSSIGNFLDPYILVAQGFSYEAPNP